MTKRSGTRRAVAVVGLAAVAMVAGVAGWWRYAERSSSELPRVTGRRWERVVVLEKFDGTRWTPVYEKKLTGTVAAGMAWPTDLPPADVPATVGALRAGARIELLYLELGLEQRALGTCRVSADVWRTYDDGATVPDAVRGSAGTLECSAL